jgi:serine-type D-Ala-D-Ala carboxypeptidase/endopeptidase (penicillin-binding protein 4)
MRIFLLTALLVCLFTSCSVTKQIEKSAWKNVLQSEALQTAHVGISVFEPSTGKYWYNYQGDKYFVPASNTKIPTCYAAMKYLGDSLVGLRYGFSDSVPSDHSVLVIQPAGDPSFLHQDFKRQPVSIFLDATLQRYSNRVAIFDTVWKENGWGSGWSWNDYEEGYMAERSSFPMFGNVVNIQPNVLKPLNINEQETVNLVKTQSPFFDTIINNQVRPWLYMVYERIDSLYYPTLNWRLERDLSKNEYKLLQTTNQFRTTQMPFVPNGSKTAGAILASTYNVRFGSIWPRPRKDEFGYACPDCKVVKIQIAKWHKILSQPTDSLLKPMMHRSDNFFAEQSLLMVSNEFLGVMNDAKIIDTILKTDFRDLPQKPRWVDGSGLSRYNLFTPQDFVSILNKMKNEFGMTRIKEIFPTGGEGTLSSYYKKDSTFIYAKTGTLSGVVALSGFLYTRGGKELIFSVLVNNHQGSATNVRRAVEKFIQGIREKY